MGKLKIVALILMLVTMFAVNGFGIDLKGKWVSVEHYIGDKEMPFLAGKSVFNFGPENKYVHDMGGFSKEEGTYKIEGDTVLFILPDGTEKKATIKGNKFIVTNELTKVKIVYGSKE
ncbi:MAG: hypothetical protein GF409_00025 [Candidatus Omnitrophica bacterium]|nr:hypothetical protein [Candidatus Omnitrophota bacterium]